MKKTKSSSPRRITLETGIYINEDTKGYKSPQVVLSGVSSRGGRYDVVATIETWWLARFATEIREHFIKLAENEKKIRDYRERAFRTPLGGQS
jgi:hypothetical protein